MKKYSINLSKDPNSGCFSAVNSEDYGLTLNGLSEADKSKGISPMEMLLAAAGGCAGIDIVCLLSKDGEELDLLDITVNGFRNLRETPAYFRRVELFFKANGNVPVDKLVSVIEESLDKYCTVGRTLEAFAEIHWSLEMNGETSELKKLEVTTRNDINEQIMGLSQNKKRTQL